VYEGARPALRDAILAHKARRRVAVGDRVTLVFEDRETLRWQVLEMCRVERIRDPRAVAHEIEVYNELVPGEGELSATLYVEITDRAEIRPELDRLIGIDEHVFLEVGDAEVQARFDPKQMEEDRIAAVQYIRFPLGPELAARFADPGVPVALRVDHPRYRARAELGPATRESLLVDLRGDPPALVDFAAAAGSPAAAPEVLAQRGRVRAVRPATPRGRGHVVVEPAFDDAPGLDEADPALLADLLLLARELAGPMRRSLGSCRISLDATATPVRLDVYAPRG
jgi:hypothetical protein